MKTEHKKLAFKLGVDAIALMLIVFAGFLSAESILPGIVSRYVTTAEVLIVLIALVVGTAALGKNIGATFPQKKPPRILVGVLVFFFIVLLANALLKFSVFSTTFIATVSVALLYFLYLLLLRKA